MAKTKPTGNEIEAANRAEATALLILKLIATEKIWYCAHLAENFGRFN